MRRYISNVEYGNDWGMTHSRREQERFDEVLCVVETLGRAGQRRLAWAGDIVFYQALYSLSSLVIVGTLIRWASASWPLDIVVAVGWTWMCWRGYAALEEKLHSISLARDRIGSIMAPLVTDSRLTSIPNVLRSLPHVDVCFRDGWVYGHYWSRLGGRDIVVDAAWSWNGRSEDEVLSEFRVKWNALQLEIVYEDRDSQAHLDGLRKKKLTWSQTSELRQLVKGRRS